MGSLRVSGSSMSRGVGMLNRWTSRFSSSVGLQNERYVVRNVRTRVGSKGGGACEGECQRGTISKGGEGREGIPYSGKLLREKTFTNFAVLWLFSAKFGGVPSFGMAKASNPRKFSPCKSYFSPIHKSFLLRKFSAIQ